MTFHVNWECQVLFTLKNTKTIIKMLSAAAVIGVLRVKTIFFPLHYAAAGTIFVT